MCRNGFPSTLSLLAFCLFFNIPPVEAKVCMITDPNCNAPLDFTMPDCDDEVVAPQYPYKDDAACEAIFGDFYTPDYSDGKRYSYSTDENKCSSTCRPKTCAEVSSTFPYKKDTNEQGLENQQLCPQEQKRLVIDETSPDLKYPYGNCYKQCTCDTGYYKFPTERCDESQNELNGESCSTNTGEKTHYKDCTPDCRNLSVQATYKFTAATCNKELYPNLTRSGQYDKTTDNNQCWESCSCSGEMKDINTSENLCADRQLIWTTSPEDRPNYQTTSGTIYCSNYDCGCKTGWKEDATAYEHYAPRWTGSDYRELFNGRKCVSDFCDRLGFKATIGTCGTSRELKCAFPGTTKAFCL